MKYQSDVSTSNDNPITGNPEVKPEVPHPAKPSKDHAGSSLSATEQDEKAKKENNGQPQGNPNSNDPAERDPSILNGPLTGDPITDKTRYIQQLRNIGKNKEADQVQRELDKLKDERKV